MKPSRKKKRRKVQVPVASMGDIAFLLIIFFLLLSEFAKDKDLAIDLPTSEQVQKTEVVVAARIAIDSEGVIYFDGDRVDNAKDVEWGVRALLSKTVADEQRHVQFKCDVSLSKATFEPVLKAIAEAGGIIEAVGEEK
ncbi:MAG: biopolymer transport protein ExbD [Pirellulaceae bacterium]